MTSEEALAKTIATEISIRQIQIGKFTINYAVAGNGPPLLLIHGANFGWGVWYPNIAEFAKHFTVYAIDLPGAGRSTRIDYSKLDPQNDLLRTVEGFIHQLNLQNINIVGCSIGGWIALELALRHPEWVHSIVLENSVGLADYMSSSDKIIGIYSFAKFISKIFIRPGTKNVEKFLRGIFYDRGLELRPEFIKYFYDTMETSHNLLFISRLTSLHKELNLEKKLKNIDKKILLIWGGGDKIIPLAKNINNFPNIKNSDLKIIKDAGHIPSLEKPDEFNALTLNFLNA